MIDEDGLTRVTSGTGRNKVAYFFAQAFALKEAWDSASEHTLSEFKR